YKEIINRFGDSCIEQFKVFDFSSGFESLTSFPISLYDNSNCIPASNSLYSQMFNTYKKIDSKGKVIGVTSREGFDKIMMRHFWRESVINFLKKAKWKMDEDKFLSKDI